MTQHQNGHDEGAWEDLAAAVAAEDVNALASQGRGDQSVYVIERVPDNGMSSFDQRAHDLMITSVDRIAQQWIAELAHVRDNTKSLEQMVIEQVTVVKAALTKLHLLGAQTMCEASRARDVVGQLARELDAMMGQYTAQARDEHQESPR
jgi:hypothetical protein